MAHPVLPSVPKSGLRWRAAMTHDEALPVAPERTSRSADLDGSGWERLLGLLGPDRDAASARYRALRGRLVDLFRWRGLGGADDLADETLHRVSLRLAEGIVIEGDVAAYAAGVARLVALEARRGERRAVPLTEAHTPIATPFARLDEDGTADARAVCATRCLGELPAPARTLLVRYHTGRGRARIDERRRLATELGLQVNALRIRIHRLRLQLEECVAACLPTPAS
jgi:DNA-directed RNA polymerase specialized sigma24 family protein